MENVTLQVILAQLINGIAIGSIYGLLTTGLNLLLVVCGVWHYAYPYVVVFSMYLAWLVHRNTGNIALTLLTAFIAGIAISLITEPLFRPLSKKSEGAPIGTFILSTGILVILADLMNNVFIRLGFTAGSVVGFPQIAGNSLIQFGLSSLTYGQAIMVIGTVISVALLFYLLYRTKLGKSFRAVSQDRVAAQLLGIPTLKTRLNAFTVAGVLGGMSSVFLIIALAQASATISDYLAIKVFAIALFAGVGNLPGGLICGLFFGVFESFLVSFLPGESGAVWGNAIAFILILATVLFRPRGIFGSRV